LSVFANNIYLGTVIYLNIQFTDFVEKTVALTGNKFEVYSYKPFIIISLSVLLIYVICYIYI